MSPMVGMKVNLGAKAVMISMQWAQEIYQGLSVSYNISVLPVVGAKITTINNTRANLTLSYNTPYNVSVVADLCGQSSVTTLTEINYGE